MPMTDDLIAKKRRAQAANMLGVSVEELDKKLPGKTKRRLFMKVKTVMETENKLLKWLIRHKFLAAALNLNIGNPDVGKTLVMIFFIAMLSRQGKKVVIICREDDYGSMWKPRFAVAKADLGNIICVHYVGIEGTNEEIPWMLDNAEHLQLLSALLTTENAEMCLIDPLADFAGKLDLNNGGDVRKITGGLDEIAKNTGVAMVVNCHTTKALVDNGIKTPAGSFQLSAAVQVSWLYMDNPDKKGERLMLQARNKSGKKRSYKYEIISAPWPVDVCGPEDLKEGETSDGVGLVKFNGETDITADDLLERKLEKSEPEVRRVRRWLEEVLAKGPVSSDDCWKEAHNREFKIDAVNKACAQMGVLRDKKTTLWQLPHTEEAAKEEADEKLPF
jgi:AAA domain